MAVLEENAFWAVGEFLLQYCDCPPEEIPQTIENLSPDVTSGLASVPLVSHLSLSVSSVGLKSSWGLMLL